MQYIDTGARLSKDGKYRYHLWREWRSPTTPNENWRWLSDDGKIEGAAVDGVGEPLGAPKSVLFVMLNPSTADGEVDDPTIRRCVAFANSWGYDRLDVVNLFAYRTSSPAELRALNFTDDPVGPDNVNTVRALIEERGDFFGSGVDKVVCAWGAHGGHMQQDEEMLGWLMPAATLCLGVTGAGYPKHPLYLRADTQLHPYK